MNARDAKKIVSPDHLMIQTTSRCNSGCVMCPWPDTAKEQAQGDMSDDLYARLVDEVKTFPKLERVLLYLMNEPLLDKKLPKRIEMMRRAAPQTEIYIITNGILLDEDLGERLIDSGLSWLGISIHAIDDATYKAVTGRADFDKIRPRLERFMERALAARGENFVQVNITKMRPHVTDEEFERAAAHWRSVGVSRVDLDDGYISRAGNVPVFGHERVRTLRTSGCQTIWAYRMAHVLFNGDVVPCCMDWRRKVKFGNVLEAGGLLNVWRGAGREGFLDKLGSGDELPPDFLCVSCEDAIPAEGAIVEESVEERIPSNGERIHFVGLKGAKVREDKTPDVLFFIPPPWLVNAPPLGIASITAYLESRGYNASVVDGNVRLYEECDSSLRNLWEWERGEFWERRADVERHFGTLLRKLADEAVATGAKVFGVNMVSRKEIATAIFLERVKELDPEIRVFVGGPGASHIELRKHIRTIIQPYIEGFLVGEGEVTMEELLRRVRAGEDVRGMPGLAQWEIETGDEVMTPGTWLPTLDVLPPPDFRPFNLDTYKSPALVVEWNRGCVGRCTFCNIPDLWKDFRYKTAERVVEELRVLTERHGVKIFNVVDPMVNGDPAVLEAICDGIIDAGLDIQWSAGMSPNREVTAEQFKKLAQAGCYRLEFGVESGSDPVLKRMGKDYKSDLAGRMIRHAHEAGIQVVLYLIVGFPKETDEDFEETLRFLEAHGDCVGLVRSVNGMVIIHDTPIERQPGSFGIDPTDRLESGWTTHWTAGDNTPELRAKRAARVTELLRRLGIPYEFENTEDVMPSEMLYKKRVEDAYRRLEAVESELTDLIGGLDKVLRGEPVRPVPGHDQVAFVLCPVWGVDMPPLGVATIAAFIRNQGYSPVAIDFNLELWQKAPEPLKRFFEEDSFRHWTDADGCRRIVAAFDREINEFVDRLIAMNRKVIGWTVYSPNRLFTIEVMRRVKRRRPDIVNVVGGRGVQTANERLIFPPDVVDFFVVGEGETTFVPLLEEIFAGRDAKGLPGTDHFVGGKLAGLKPRPRLEDLSLLPPAAYDLFDIPSYRSDEIPVQMARGCVAFCTFCNDNHKNTGFRNRPGAHAAAEIAHHVRTLGVKKFRFNDLLLNGNIPALEELCDVLIKEDLGVEWICLFQPRGDMSDDLLFKMAKAGCYTVNMGVEHASDHVLKRMGKGFRVSDMERALRQARAAGINTMLNFIVGFPGERPEDVDKIIEFIQRNREFICGITSINSCILLEDAAIERSYDKLGITFPEMATRDVNWVLGDNTPEERQRRLKKVIDFIKAEDIPFLVSNLQERAADISTLPDAPPEPAPAEEKKYVLTNMSCEPSLDDGFDPSKGEPRFEEIPRDAADVMIIKAPVWGVDVAPLAIAYLSQMVREAGLRVQALDLNVKIYNRCHDRGLWSMDRYNEWADIGLFPKTYESLWELTEHYLKQIAAHPAPLVAFSVCTSNYLFTLETARRLKAMAPKKKVIMGGPAITNSFDVERIEPHECDYLFFGEADLEFAEIVRAVKDGREPGDVPGMVKVGTKFTYDSVHRSIVKKGVVLPTPTFEELNLDEYSGTAVPLLGSRGCVRKCTFCNDHQIYQKYRHRTAQEIFSDLEWHVVNRGAAHFTFLDLLMNGHMKVLEEFCDMVIEKGYKVAWGGQCIVRKEMTREMLEKMKRAGCQSIVYGIESFNDKVLRLMRKYYTQDLAKRVLTDTHEVGIESIINIIVGFPGEGEEEFLDTYNFVRDNREIIGQVASVSPCLVNLGSELFDRFEEFGIIFPPEGGSVKWSTKDGSSTYEQRLDRLMRVTELLASRDKHIHTVNVYDKDDRDKRLAKDDLARKSGRVADDKEGEHAMAEGLATAALATNIDGMSEEERDRYRFGAANASPRVNPQGRRAREMVENLDVGTAEMAEPAATNGTNGHGKNGTNGSTKARGEAMCDVVLALMPPWGVRFPPLSLAALAAATRAEGYKVAVRDMNIECFAKCGEYLKTWWEPENLKYWSPGDRFKEVSAFLLPQIEAFVDDIAKKRPIVVGFSVNESNLPFTNRVAERIREKLPMAKVIYGGAGIAWPEERRKLVSEAVDGFVIGEGEVALPSLLDALMNGGVWEDVPGLEWAGGPIEKEPSKDLLIPSLDALPTPDFSDFPLGLYQTRQLPLEFGRGCPNRCTFCNDPKIMPKYRFKSPERMLEDVKHYKQLYGGHDFQFNDLLINAHVENLRRFAELVVRDGVRMAYSGQAIINKRLTDETLAVLKQSGCTSLVFGVESFSDKVLDSMKKGYDSTMARTVIERVHRAGIKVIVNLIVGFPGETELELNETMEFLRAHRHMIDSVSALSACIVTPQCDLERHPEKYGIVLPKPEHWCQWYTEDGANTYDVRQKRLYKMIALCDELGLMRGMTNRYLEMVDGRAVAQA